MRTMRELRMKSHWVQKLPGKRFKSWCGKTFTYPPRRNFVDCLDAETFLKIMPEMRCKV